MRYWIAGLFLCVSCGVNAQPVKAITEENLRQFFDAAFSVQQKEHEIVGAVVSVVYNGGVVFKAGYGFADLEARVPADPDQSLFRIASITKPFVWTAIMQLVEQGRLQLDDPVDGYLDFEIPATFDDPIRIRHLLTHTPGFEEKGTGSVSRSLEEVLPLGEYLQQNMPARVRSPGTQASYSNYGTDLAGYIIQRITGQSWADYVDEHVLTPLAMTSTNTQMVMDAGLQARHAKGYRYQGGQFVPNGYEYFGGTPAGHISTTADDMTRFMLAHLNDGAFATGRILKPATARQMQQPLFTPHELSPPMLHGFYRTDRAGLKVFGHGGDVNQFHSNLSLIPEAGLGVFISFNSDPASSARSQLVAAFIDHFFGHEYLPPSPSAAAVDLEAYAGSYLALRRNYSTFEKLAMLVSEVTVSAQDNELVVGGGGTSRWIAIGPDQFRGKYHDRNLVFTRDASGAITHMTIGGPLGTLERVAGLDKPSSLQRLLGVLFLIALCATLGYGYRLARYRQAMALPRVDVCVAWVFSLLVIILYGYLVLLLSDDPEEFAYGVPTAAHVSLLLMSVNAVLGLITAWLAARQWVTGAGSLTARLGYSLVALAALINVWVCSYFNILSYSLYS
ncbi:MAG: serine hydrolase domain-containing protein [Pseudomonadota bacterium]